MNSQITTVLITQDVAGVPDRLLLLHLYRHKVQLMHSLPVVVSWMGFLGTAVAYGIDIGERSGCEYRDSCLPAAVIIFLLPALFWYQLKRNRQDLNTLIPCDNNAEDMGSTNNVRAAHHLHLGTAVFTTWTDILPREIGSMQ